MDNELQQWVSIITSFQLDNPSDFEYDAFSEKEFMKLCDYIRANGSPAQSNFHFSTGVSKGVIIPANKDYVIKIPFSCDLDKDYSTFYTTGGVRTWQTSYNYDSRQFENAYNPITGYCGHNYCAVEAAVYEMAVWESIDYMFAPTTLITDSISIPIYKQMKVLPLDEDCGASTDADFNSATNAEIQIVDEISSYDSAGWMPQFFIYWLYKTYGVENTMQLFCFLDDNDINDFHEGNIARDLTNGLPILMDYSGFHN